MAHMVLWKCGVVCQLPVPCRVPQAARAMSNKGPRRFLSHLLRSGMRFTGIIALSFAFVASTFAAPVVAATARETLIGVHPDGDLIAVAVDDDTLGDLIRLCRLNTSELPNAWPPALRIDDGNACATLTDDDAGAPAAAFAKALVKGGKTAKTSPWGISVALTVASTTHTLTASGAPKDPTVAKASITVDSALPLSIAEQAFSADGGAVVVALVGGDKRTGTRQLVFVDLGPALVGGPAGAKLAAARVKEAQKRTAKREWSEAGALLDEALVGNPDDAAVHYARAAVEAQNGIGKSTMVEHLNWLKDKSATMPAAKKLLESAQKDRAFDAWVGEPEVREVLGLPSLSTMSVEARLLERGATFTRQGTSCGRSWLTLTFLKGGKGTLQIADSCKGKKSAKKQPFTWSVDGEFAKLNTKAIDVGDDEHVADALSVELDGTYQQLRLSTDGISAIGPFEPGPANVDDAL
jgi:hypothetical protein